MARHKDPQRMANLLPVVLALSGPLHFREGFGRQCSDSLRHLAKRCGSLRALAIELAVRELPSPECENLGKRQPERQKWTPRHLREALMKEYEQPEDALRRAEAILRQSSQWKTAISDLHKDPEMMDRFFKEHIPAYRDQVPSGTVCDCGSEKDLGPFFRLRTTGGNWEGAFQVAGWACAVCRFSKAGVIEREAE